MALTRTISNGNATYTFKYTATTTIIDKKADQAAHYLFDMGYGDHGTEEVPKTYDMLTAAEKRTILDKHVLQVILDASKAYRVNADMDVSRQSAIDAEESEEVTI